eukprot:scaffold271159_cov99-Cyclotella_meneghiniana.AAC.2
MDIDTSTQKTPLLAHNDAQGVETIKSRHGNTPDIQFYDPNVILDVPKEIALGYLVLLTGGNYDDEHQSTINESKIDKGTGDKKAQDNETNAYQSQKKLPEIDEQTVALAYAAIVDGNVLHTCFGLKSGPNGRPTSVIGDKESVSIFCCFPSASGTTLQNLRCNKSKKDMTKLVEILRDVKDLDCGTKGTVAKDTQQVDKQVIISYIKCFATIVKYHDEISLLQNTENLDSKAKQSFCSCPSFLVNLRNMLFSSTNSKLDSKTEVIQKSVLGDIERTFDELSRCIAEAQMDVVSVAETGVTVEDM